jgi:hypothetical protein
MSVEITVVTKGFLKRLQRAELRSLNPAVVSFFHSWKDPLDVSRDCGDRGCPYVLTTRSAVEAAQAEVIRQSIGIGSELTAEELDELLAKIHFHDIEGNYRNLLRFLDTESVAVPDNLPSSERSDVTDVVVPLPALLRDLESVVPSIPTISDQISPAGLLGRGLLQWLLGAARWCLGHRQVLSCMARVDKWDGWTTIRDRRIGEQGFNRFEKVSVDQEGRLLVRFVSGASYRIPAKYLGVLVGVSAGDMLNGCWLQRARILPGREQIRIEFLHGSVATLIWEDILMAFEPRYEHFGGFPGKEMTFVDTWDACNSSFRVYPREGLVTR